MKITYRKITQADLDRAEKRLAQKIASRGLRKYVHKVKDSGASFSGAFNSFSAFDAECLVAESYVEEMAGYPMPPELPSEMGALDGWIKKIKDKFNKAANKLAGAVHKTMKKIGPAVMGMIVGMIAGPAVGAMVGKAVGSVASKYIGKKVQANQLRRMISNAQSKAAAASAEAYKDVLLPVGVSPGEARAIGAGKIPASMTDEKVWHAIEQAKLINQEKLKPLDAYVLHYHSYQQDAPSVTFTPPEVWNLIEQLKDVKSILENEGTISNADAIKLKKNKYFQQCAPKDTEILPVKSSVTFAQILKDPSLRPASYKGSNAAQKFKDELKAKNANMTYEQYMNIKRINQAQIELQQKLMGLNGTINCLQTIKTHFPGAPFPKQASTMPVPTDTKHETQIKENTVKTVLEPNVTEMVMEKAKEELRKQNIDVESPEANELLKLQIEKLQQDVAKAVANNQPIVVERYSPQPEIKVTDTGEGKAVEVKKEPVSATAMLLPAAAIFLALKGG